MGEINDTNPSYDNEWGDLFDFEESPTDETKSKQLSKLVFGKGLWKGVISIVIVIFIIAAALGGMIISNPKRFF